MFTGFEGIFKLFPILATCVTVVGFVYTLKADVSALKENTNTQFSYIQAELKHINDRLNSQGKN